MKQLTDTLISEMSAWHNRANDELALKIAKIEAEMSANSKADRERILNAAGLKGGAKTKAMYDYAMDLVADILQAEKPYGAIVFILTHLQECAKKYLDKQPKAKETLPILEKVLTSSAIDELIGNDKAYDALKKKIDKMKEKEKRLDSEAEDLKQKLLNIEANYPALKYYRN